MLYRRIICSLLLGLTSLLLGSTVYAADVFTISAWRTPLNSDGYTAQHMLLKIKDNKVIAYKKYYSNENWTQCTPTAYHPITAKEKQYPPIVPENYYDNFDHVAKIGAWNYYFILDKTPRVKSEPFELTVENIKFKLNMEHHTATILKADFSDVHLDFTIPKTLNYEGDVYKIMAIGYDAFRNNKLNSLTVPSSITQIDKNAFDGMTVKTLILPSSISRIGSYAFANLKGLRYIEIPFKALPAFAFANCKDLETVVFSAKGFSSIGYDAFTGCTNLKNIYFYTKLPPECTGSYSYKTAEGERIAVLNQFPSEMNTWWNPKPKYKVNIHIPKGCKKYYKEKEPWKLFKLKETIKNEM